MYCVYRITNIINGKTYIGQHQYTDESNPMKGYFGSGKILKLAIKKHGISNFVKEVLYCRIVNADTADSIEVFAISKEKALGHAEYNIMGGGQARRMSSDKFSRRISEGMKASGACDKISKSKTGCKNPRFSKPALNKGVPASEAAKEKNRLAHIGMKMSEESKQKRRDFMKAHPNPGMFKKGRISNNKGKIYYKDPNSSMCGLYFIGAQPEGWVKGRYTPWQGKNK